MMQVIYSVLLILWVNGICKVHIIYIYFHWHTYVNIEYLHLARDNFYVIIMKEDCIILIILF